MAAQLVNFYERIGQAHGALGRMKLAMLTNVSSAQAKNAADSQENIQKFEKALAQVLSELKG